MLNEAQIINLLQQEFPESIGDDAAVLPFLAEKNYVLTKDILIEDIHFRASYQNAISLAYKALQVNLSDIAAMGATPKYVLLGISIPEHHAIYSQEFLINFAKACKASEIILIGGDTTKSTDKLFISITAIGIASNTHIKLRKSAAPDHIICVAGNLGYAHLGFIALEHNQPGWADFKNAFLNPQALVKEGEWLGAQQSVTAMMDISDGLYIDLKRLCRASQVSAEINLDYFQPSESFESACKHFKLDPIITQLTGGEDYGLLLTLKPKEYQNTALNFKHQFGYALKPIGRIMPGNHPISFIEKGSAKTLELQPFTHFGEQD